MTATMPSTSAVSARSRPVSSSWPRPPETKSRLAGHQRSQREGPSHLGAGQDPGRRPGESTRNNSVGPRAPIVPRGALDRGRKLRDRALGRERDRRARRHHDHLIAASEDRTTRSRAAASRWTARWRPEQETARGHASSPGFRQREPSGTRGKRDSHSRRRSPHGADAMARASVPPRALLPAIARPPGPGKEGSARLDARPDGDEDQSRHGCS